MNEQETPANDLNCMYCGRRHEVDFACKPYIDSKLTADPGSFIRGIACEKHDLVSATIACTRCMDELCKERDTLRVKLEETKANMYRLAQERKAAVSDMEKLRKERDEARREQNADERICAQRDQALKQRDEARALCDEASRQRDGWREKYQSAQARIDEMDNSDLEPSRLEIAARIIQGWAANPEVGATSLPRDATARASLRIADTLIAAAKEVAK